MEVFWQLIAMLIFGFGLGVCTHDFAVITGLFEKDTTIRDIHGYIVGLPMIVIGVVMLILP